MCWAFPFLAELICHGHCSQRLFQSTSFMLLSHSFIVSSNLKTIRQMIQHKSLHVDHSGQIHLCWRESRTTAENRKHTRCGRCADSSSDTSDTFSWFWTHVSDFIFVAFERSGFVLFHGHSLPVPCCFRLWAPRFSTFWWFILTEAENTF